MPSAFLSPDEAGRLVALHRLGVLDSPHEPGFDSLAACAARVSACPGALISLVDARRVWFKARVGFGTAETARDRAFCSHAILGDGPLVVPDASRDARFADHPMVLGEPHMCFYAGLPLRIDGAKVGTLAVFDTMPRTLDDAARRALDSLARVAEAMLHARERLCAVELERTRALDFAGASGDWMWELDRELRYCWLSASFEAMTGISSASMLGQPIADSALLDTDGTPIAGPKGLRDLLARHARLSRVVTRKATPRGPLLVSRSALPVFDAQATFQGYRGTARDVTQQVRAENLAHAKDQLLRGIAAQVPGVIFQLEIQPDGGQRFRYISDAVQQVFGLQVEQVMADPTLPFRMVHRDDHGAVFKGLGAAGDSLQPWRGEYRLVLADGQERWVGSRATPERAEGGSVLWTGFTADIGESKQTELSLRRSEERWELAADAAGIGIAQLQPASAEVRFDARA